MLIFILDFITNKTWIFHQSISATGLKWTKSFEDIPKRHYHMTCIHNDQLIVFGGFFENDQDLDSVNDLWAFDVSSKSWRLYKTTGETPGGIAYGQMLSYKDRIFLVGGQRTQTLKYGEEKQSNDIYQLDFKTMKWSMIKSKSEKPPLMSHHGANIWNDEVIVFGGVNVSTKQMNSGERGDQRFQYAYSYCIGNKVHVFNLETRKWRQIITHGKTPCPRYGHSTFIYQGHLIVVGGAASCSKSCNDFWSLDMRHNNWTWRRVTCTKNKPFMNHEIGASPMCIVSIIFESNESLNHFIPSL